MSNTQRSHPRRVVNAATSILLGALAILALLLVVLGVVARPGHDGVSRVAGHPILTVLSGSMTPVFRPGDLAIDDPVPTGKADQLVPGDVITFHVSGSATNLITHKIIAVKHEKGGVSYQTQGVANNAPDPELVQPTQIVGTYRMHIPMAGYLLQAIQKKTIFFLLILVPLLYLGISEATKRSRKEAPADASAASVAATAPERLDESLVGAGAPSVYRDAISTLRREQRTTYVTGEGGDASV